MSKSVRLRPWQQVALARFTASSSTDFRAVATPGAGKTTFALAALRTILAGHAARVVIVAPPLSGSVEGDPVRARDGWSP